MSQVPDLAAEYDNRARFPDHLTVMAGWAREAAAWRRACPDAELDVAYGPGERERLDLFWPAAGRDAPLAIFIHGGYWQALDKSWVSGCARGLNGCGVAVAVPSYDLCPAVPLRRIVEQMRAAAGFLHARLGRRMLAAGHSAGGHLAAMLLGTDWGALGLPADLVPAAVPVSGVFELEPVITTPTGAGLRLEAAEARALSPRWLPVPPLAPRALHAVVGGAETDEFRRQTREFAVAWGGTSEELPGRNHFDVLGPLGDPVHPLVRRMAGMVPRR